MRLHCLICGDETEWDRVEGDDAQSVSRLPTNWRVLEVTNTVTQEKAFVPWCDKHSMTEVQLKLNSLTQLPISH